MDPWWTPAMEEEAIMRIHRIQHKRILEGLVKETLKWCREITWNSLLQFVCLKQDCTQWWEWQTSRARTPWRRHSYSMEPKKLLKNVLLHGLGGNATLLFYVKVSCYFSMWSSPFHRRRRATTRSFIWWCCQKIWVCPCVSICFWNWALRNCKTSVIRLQVFPLGWCDSNRIRLRISHPSIVVAAVGGQVIETKLRSLDGLSKKKQHQTIHWWGLQ